MNKTENQKKAEHQEKMDVRWDMTPVYPAPDSAEFQKDLNKLREILQKFQQTVVSKDVNLAELIQLNEQIGDLFTTMRVYAECLVYADTSDKKAVAALNRVEALNPAIASAKTAFAAFIKKHPGKVKEFVTGNPEYAYVLEEIRKSAGHTMKPEMEILAADLLRSGSDSFERLQQAIASSAKEKMNGKEMTVNELRALATSKERYIRKKAFEAELKAWKQYEVPLAFALNSVKGTCLSLEARRKWDSPIKRSAADSRVSEKTLNALIRTLEKSLPMFRRYLKAKAKLLGVRQLAFYDLFAPVGGNGMEYTYDEARSFVVKQYSSFNPVMGVFAENAFRNRWIDPFPRDKKGGGAFDEYLPNIRESRILANFDGTYDGVSTFAHELGHAWHDHMVSDQPFMLRQYPMTLAETASLFSEYIAMQGALGMAEEEQQLSIIEYFLQNACQVCVDILCRYYFEREVFERRKDGELMPEDLCRIMTDCQKKTYGNGLDSKYLHPYMWAVKVHYYSTAFSFYNYPYAFGQLFALSLASKWVTGSPVRENFESYNALLRLTGQMSCEQAAASAGFDISKSAFWQNGMDLIEGYVKQFERIVTERSEALVLFTNDVHGNLSNYPVLAAYKEDQESNGRNILLADAGDFSQGALIANHYRGRSVIQIMNMVGYDVVVPGNHELDHGVDDLKEMMADFQGTPVASNLIEAATGKTVFPPYLIKETAGFRIAFVGCMIPYKDGASGRKEFQDASGKKVYDLPGSKDDQYAATIDLFQKAVDQARAEGADVVIGLVHIGSLPYPALTSSQLAARISGVDVYLDAHDHKLHGKRRKKTLSVIDPDGKEITILEAGTQLTHLGRVRIVRKNGKPVLMADTVPIQFLKKGRTRRTAAGEKRKKSIEELIKRYSKGLKEYDQVVGASEVSLYCGGTEYMDFRHNFCRFVANSTEIMTGADLCLYNVESICRGLSKGLLRKRDINDMFPFDDSIRVLPLTGEKLLRILEYEARVYPDYQIDLQAESSAIDYTVDAAIPGRYVMDETGRVSFDLKAPSRIKNVTIRGKELEKERIYQVAATTFAFFNLLKDIVELDEHDYEPVGTQRSVFERYLQEKLGGVIRESDIKDL